MMACILMSPFVQMTMIRHIVAERELANNIAHAWVVLIGLGELIFMLSLARKPEGKVGSAS